MHAMIGACAIWASAMLPPAAELASNTTVVVTAGRPVISLPQDRRVLVVPSRNLSPNDWQGADGFGRFAGIDRRPHARDDRLLRGRAGGVPGGRYYSPRYYSDPTFFGD